MQLKSMRRRIKALMARLSGNLPALPAMQGPQEVLWAANVALELSQRRGAEAGRLQGDDIQGRLPPLKDP